MEGYTAPPPAVRARLKAGQQFNAYRRAGRRGYVVAIGPITDCLWLLDVERKRDADWLADVLRKSVDQRPAAAR